MHYSYCCCCCCLCLLTVFTEVNSNFCFQPRHGLPFIYRCNGPLEHMLNNIDLIFVVVTVVVAF